LFQRAKARSITGFANVRTVVVQYSDNDAVENAAFTTEGQWHVMSAREYFGTARLYAAGREYYPGKFIADFSPLLLARMLPAAKTGDAPKRDYGSEAKAFSAILSALSVDRMHTRLVILDINSWGQGDRSFIDAVLAVQEPKLSDVFPDHTLIDTRTFLSRDDFFVHDTHLTVAGHEKLAAVLSKYVH
jgi:hypothetical protein